MNLISILHNRNVKAVVYLEKRFPHNRRDTFLFFMKIALSLSLLFFIFTLIVPGIENIFDRALGIMLIIASIFLLIYVYELFYRSIYFSYPPESFEAAQIILNAKGRDLLREFSTSKIGKMSLKRANIDPKIFKKIIKKNDWEYIKITNEFDHIEDIDIKIVISFLFRNYKGFPSLLFKGGIQEHDFIDIVNWALRESDAKHLQERWWDNERLQSVKALGTELSYGQTYFLNHYGRVVQPLYTMNQSQKSVIEQMISVLSRSAESNLILVGPPGVGRMELVRSFVGKINLENISKLLNRRTIIFETELLIADSKDKVTLESNLVKLFREVEHAGNVMLVITDFPGFIRSARALGSDIGSLIDDFLISPSIQIIGISDEYAFQKEVFPNEGLMIRFQKISIPEPIEREVYRIIEREVAYLEKETKSFFTFQSIKAIVQGAQRYITTGVMPKKALDLAEEIAHGPKYKEGIITAESIAQFLQKRTKIPMGKIKEEEKEKLLNLEEFLHRRVIGQDHAITLVANTMRRARAGIENEKRPMGTLLFLGPTGVGKTETAKALAEALFDNEDKLMRIDMSEYQDENSLQRLIGSFEGNKAGVLSTMLRAKPYGVLLLDEFEKTNSDVHDLFLQIFDEGRFSDMNGRPVNARNIIFIATSNAESDFIFQAVQSGRDVSSMHDTVVNNIISNKIFKPELLNRFDAVVLFHPLDRNHLIDIARIMANKLRDRLLKKNIDLVIDDELVEFIVEKGMDPKFGARPMNRLIQETIEKVIAEKMISGELPPGSQFTFSRDLLQ